MMAFPRFKDSVDRYVLATFGFLLFIASWQVYTQLSVYLRRSRYKKETGCQVPPSYSNLDPIFGLDVLWRNFTNWKQHNLLPELTSRYQRYGNTYSIIIGGQRVLSTIEPENLKVILSTNFTSYDFGPVRTKALKPLLGDSIFTLSGPRWQHSRAMIRPNLIKDQFVDAEMSTFEKHLGRLLLNIPRDGSIIDLQPMFFSYTLSAALEILTGQDIHTSEKSTDSGDEVTKMFDDAEQYVGNQVLLGALPFGNSKRKYLRACKSCHDWVDKYVHQAIKEYRSGKLKNYEEKEGTTGRKYSVLRELVKETDNSVMIRSELIAILTAGRETTASALSSLWFTLAKRPDVVEKIRLEVVELGGERPNFTQLKKMRYLQNTIQEVLRLYPPLPANMRTATADTILPTGGGTDHMSPIFVSKGQLIIYNVYAMHRRHDIFGTDAEVFRPERWEDKSLRPGWGYLPFNGGPRICLGQQFALTEIAYTTVRLLQEFSSVESYDSEPWQEKWLINCAVKSGCKVSLKV
ncbi:cytochrome P450 alkane hydroxylase [Tricladium varicosporioides]|nr:cytochrome P450 alkane hydroxylase [Hymenoscyphus varicosporioides]